MLVHAEANFRYFSTTWNYILVLEQKLRHILKSLVSDENRVTDSIF